MTLNIKISDDKARADYERLRADFNDLYNEVQGIQADREDSARAQYQVRTGDQLDETSQNDRIFALETKTSLLTPFWAELVKRLEKTESAISDKFTGTYAPNELALALRVDVLSKELALQNKLRQNDTHTQARIVDEYRVKIEALETLLSSTVASIGHLQSRIDTQSRINANNTACVNDLMKLLPAPKHPKKQVKKNATK